jgi:hypothetical protein
MSALVASVAAGTVLACLLIACAAHLSRPSALPRALAAHRVVPVPTVVAALVTASEGLLAGVGAAGLVRGDGQGLLTAALAGSVVLLALFGGYAWYVTATRRGGPCGCSRAPLPMSGWVAGRAFALAGLALVALVALAQADSVAPPRLPGADLAIVVLAVATFTCLLWQLPAAMHNPGPTQRQTQRQTQRSSPTRAGGAVVRE